MRASSFVMSIPLLLLAVSAFSQGAEVRTGLAAFGNWQNDAPGVSRQIRPTDLPRPTHADNDPEAADFQRRPKVVEAPQGKMPDVPKGFAVQVFAKGLKQPRVMQIAPNGDIFAAESGNGRVLVFPAAAAKDGPATPEVFAENLQQPYGIVFHPPADPQHIYVAAANQVVRFPYRNGDRKATGPAEIVIANIPTKRHWTRDLEVSRDGRRIFISIGSASNVAAGMPDKTPRKFEPMKRRTGLEPPGARKRTGPWCACSIPTATPSVITQPACAIAPAWPCSRAPTPYGAQATNETISALIWCRTS